MPAMVIAFIGALVFGAHLFVAIFARTRVPDVLLLILIGLLLGPVTHLVRPEQFGSVGPVFTTVTLVFLLFESGTELQLGTIRKVLHGSFLLSVLNFLVTTALVAFAAWKFAHLSMGSAVLLGTILGGTSPAVVIPIAAQLKMHKHASAILFLESAISDVVSIVLALALVNALHAGDLEVGKIIGTLLGSFLLAGVLGALGSIFWSNLLSRVRTLQNGMFTTAAFLFLIFGLAELLGYSGAIAALVFGIGLGNVAWHGTMLSKRFPTLEPVGLNSREKGFFAEIVFLLKTFFFVYIGLSIQFRNLSTILFGLAITVLLFVMRIPVVRFGVTRTTSRKDASRMAAMAPKGLAAAVLASLPKEHGLLHGNFIQNTTYAVVLMSILLTAILIFLQDRTPVGRMYRWFFAGFGLEPAEDTSNAE